MAWISRDNYVAVGVALTEVRKRVGVSQDELARRLGKPQSFVSACERGQRRIDIIELSRIAGALGIDSLVLFSALTGQD